MEPELLDNARVSSTSPPLTRKHSREETESRYIFGGVELSVCVTFQYLNRAVGTNVHDTIGANRFQVPSKQLNVKRA